MQVHHPHIDFNAPANLLSYHQRAGEIRGNKLMTSRIESGNSNRKGRHHLYTILLIRSDQSNGTQMVASLDASQIGGLAKMTKTM